MTNKLLQLQEQQHLDAVDEIDSPEAESVAENAISASDIKIMLTKQQGYSEFVEKYHPANIFTDRAMIYFMTLLQHILVIF